MVADLLLPNGSWNINKMEDCFSPADCLLIQEIHRPRQPEDDIWIWTPSLSGKLSTKSAYWLDQGSRFQSRACWNRKSWSCLWSSKLLPRHKLMWWLCLLSVLPTRSRLARFLHITDISCPLCNSANESTEHLFSYYPMAAHLWFNSEWQLNTQSSPGKSMFDWCNELWYIET